MKKAYSKPDILFESFSLATSIAAGCEEKAISTQDACGVDFGKSVIFTDAAYGCSSIIVDGATEGNRVDKENNGLCYHNPSSTYNVFIS